MSEVRRFRVKTREGPEAEMFAASRFLDNGDRRLLKLWDGRELLIPKRLLRLEADGSYFLTVPLSELEGVSSAPAEQEGNTENYEVFPAIEEQLEVGKKEIETGRVRVHKRVETSESVIDEPLMHENYDVQRVAVNRILEEPLEARYEGDTLILPVMEEILVVEKRLMLREEVRVTRIREETHDPQKHTVRREHLEVERVSPSSEVP